MITIRNIERAADCVSMQVQMCIRDRHLGVHTGRVSRDDFRQIQMFDKVNYEKARKLECAVDSIRKRYGMDSIKRACFISSPGKAEIDHMGGGISREKRTVDYTKERVL